MPGNVGNSNFYFLSGAVFGDNVVVDDAQNVELGISIVHL